MELNFSSPTKADCQGSLSTSSKTLQIYKKLKQKQSESRGKRSGNSGMFKSTFNSSHTSQKTCSELKTVPDIEVFSAGKGLDSYDDSLLDEPKACAPPRTRLAKGVDVSGNTQTPNPDLRNY